MATPNDHHSNKDTQQSCFGSFYPIFHWLEVIAVDPDTRNPFTLFNTSVVAVF